MWGGDGGRQGGVTSQVTVTLRGAFDEAGGAHTTAHAHRDDGVLALAALELVQRRRDLARARTAERVPERDGAPVDVDAVLRQPELAQAVERLRRERLVDLVEIDLVDLEAG